MPSDASAWSLHSQLKKDTIDIGDLPLCRVVDHRLDDLERVAAIAARVLVRRHVTESTRGPLARSLPRLTS